MSEFIVGLRNTPFVTVLPCSMFSKLFICYHRWFSVIVDQVIGDIIIIIISRSSSNFFIESR